MGLRSVVKLVLTVVFVWFAAQVVGLARNYQAARRTGLPILINPTRISSPAWLLCKPLLVRLFAGWDWIHRIDPGWTLHARWAPYEKTQSRAFWVVNPASKQLFIADPAAADDIMRRCRTEFVKSADTYIIMDIYGKNVDSANGKVWEKHRRVTVPPFNERVSEAVWDETGRQIEGARRKWEQAGVVRSTQEDTTRVAFNVLSATGFGMQCDFDGESYGEGEMKKLGHRLSYKDALGHMLNNVVVMIVYVLLRKMGLPSWAMFGSLGDMSVAKEEFGQYMKEMLRKEREGIRDGSVTKESLMSVLVRSSDEGAAEASATAGPVLTDDEIMGNLFVYNIAGHDTTAGTMHYAITMLAADPKWQAWLAEEIDDALRKEPAIKYSALFPKLSRCQAVMYETLRLYGPVPAVPRWTASRFVPLHIDGKEVAIPPDTICEVDIASLHHDPRSWGPDRLAFRPDRWLRKPSAGGGPASADHDKQHTAASAASNERTYDWQSRALIAPTPGSFFPWTGGPRVCPGKKFSQVEFTRAMLGLFSGGRRVAIVAEDGESQEEATARAQRILQDPKISITVRMKDSEQIGLRWYVTS